jgi:hypothetical protein
MGFEVVEVQSTPNPNAAKFVLDRPVAEQPVSFLSADAASNHRLVTDGLVTGELVAGESALGELAVRLFTIPGVSSVLFLRDFVTVNKRPEARWPGLKRAVKKVLAEG